MALVVVSHSRQDTELAARVHRWLVGAGHEVLLDADPVDGVPAGGEWRDRLWERLRRADALVCVVTEAYRASEYCSGEICAALSRGVLILPLLADSGERHPLLRAVEHLPLPPDADDDADGAPLWLLGALAFVTAAGERGRPGGESPFPGLDAFDMNRQKVFFGRDGEIRALTRAVIRPDPDGMLLVVGPSGCGKSSLVRAGLIPRITAQGDWWTVPAFRPETDPVTQLAVGLARAGVRLGLDWSAPSVLHRLRGDGLPAVVGDLLAAAPDPAHRHRLLIVVDQFEQLLITTPPQRRAEFVDLLHPVVPGTVGLVGALRTEFLDAVAADDALADLAPFATYPLTPLGQARLGEVIREPAELADLRLDDDLIEQMVRDTGSGQALPLLAFALQRLTDNAERGARLTLEDYHRIGGVRGALGDQARAALDAAQRTTGRSRDEVLNDLCRLVVIDTDNHLTARTITTAGLPGHVLDHLRCFRDRCLLTGRSPSTTETDTTIDVTAAGRTRAGTGPVAVRHDHADPESPGTVRLAHESLITAWKPLHDAVEARRDRRRRARLTAAVIAAIAIAGIATLLWSQARAQRQVAVARELMAQAQAVGDTDTRLALALGVAAYDLHPTPEAETWLWSSLDAPYVRSTSMTGHTDTVYSVAFSPDGHTLATASADRTVILWDLTTPAPLARVGRPLTSHTAPVYSVAYSPDGHTLATGSADRTVILWDLSDPVNPVRIGRPIAGHTGAVHSVAYSPDGHTLATAGEDRTVILWDLDDPVNPVRIGQSLTGHTGTVYSVVFSRNGNTLATAGHDQTVILWDLSDPATPTRIGQPLTGHTGTVPSVAFAPDGHTLATASWDRTVILWDLTTLANPVRIGRPLTGHTGPVYSVALAPDGYTLATAGGDGTVFLWDLADPATPARIGQPLAGHTGPVYSVAFTPDGRTLATAATDGTVILWKSAELARYPRGSAVEQACAQLGRGLSENEWATYIAGLDYRKTCP